MIVLNHSWSFYVCTTDGRSLLTAVVNVSNTHTHKIDRNASDRDTTEKLPITNPRGDYKGTCTACGGKNHHAASCFFLQKVELVLKFLAEQPKIAKEFHKEYHAKNNSKIAIVQSLKNSKYIPDKYKSLDPAIFIDAM